MPPKKKPDDDRGLELTLKVDGELHVFRYKELTAIDVRDCRKETGFTLNRLLGMVGDSDVDIDSLAAILWLARRQEGERGLRYDAVAATIRPDSDLTVDVYVPGGDAIDVASTVVEESPDPE